MTRWLAALALLAAVPAQAAKVTVPFTVAPAPVGTCPDDDGSSGATAGAPNLPTALAAYVDANTIHRLGCKIAGVDSGYHVGVGVGAALRLPASGNLPTGCSLNGNVVSCLNRSGMTFSGYDMTGKQLDVSGSNITITGNKWDLTSNCLAAITYAPSGTWHIEQNSMNGHGLTTCSNGLAGGLSALVYNAGGTAAGAVVYIRWNEFIDTPEDTLNLSGSSGASSAGMQPIIAFNLWNGQANVGHPDGIQMTRGTFRNIQVLHNTYVNTRVNNDPGIQPLHLEAQLSSNVFGAVTAYNTVVTPGNCQGGNNWPPHTPDSCVVNFDFACKNDPGYSPPDSFTGYAIHDNFADATGAIAATATKSYDCTNTTSANNIDMTTGKAFSNAD